MTDRSIGLMQMLPSAWQKTPSAGSAHSQFPPGEYEHRGILIRAHEIIAWRCWRTGMRRKYAEQVATEILDQLQEYFDLIPSPPD